MKKIVILSASILVSLSLSATPDHPLAEENKISLTTEQASNIVTAFMNSIITGDATAHLKNCIAQNEESIQYNLANFLATLNLSAQELTALQQLSHMILRLNYLLPLGEKQFSAVLEEGKKLYEQEAARLRAEGIGITYDMHCVIQDKVNATLEQDPSYKEYFEGRKILPEINKRFLFALGGNLGEYLESMDQEAIHSIKQQRLVLLDELCKFALPIIEQEIQKKKLTQELQINILDIQLSDNATSSSAHQE